MRVELAADQVLHDVPLYPELGLVRGVLEVTAPADSEKWTFGGDPVGARFHNPDGSCCPVGFLLLDGIENDPFTGQHIPGHGHPAVRTGGKTVSTINYFQNICFVLFHLLNRLRLCTIRLNDSRVARRAAFPSNIQANTISALHRRILFFSILFILHAGFLCAAQVTVTVTGIEDGLHENVMARLSLYRLSTRGSLNSRDVRRLHRKAEKEIRAALAPFGYYSPRVAGELKEEGDEFFAEYRVDRGEPVRVRSVDVKVVSSSDVFSLFENAEEEFPLQEGKVLHQGTYENGKKRILRTAFSQGFLDARFTVQELQIDRGSLAADIVLEMETGPQFFFGETTFSAGYLNQELMVNYVPYQKGDPYRPAKLLELQTVLYKTNYFSSVIVEGRVEDTDNLAVPVYVKTTTPEKRNRYSVGIGYATDTGERARFEWRNRLLNSNGHTLFGKAYVSTDEKSIGFDYKVPFGNISNDKIAYSAAYNDQLWNDTETRLISTGVGLEHHTRKISHGGSLEYRDEDYSVGSTSGKIELIMPSFTVNMVWADDLRRPEYGLQISASVSGSVEELWSDTTFLKGVVGGKLIITPFPGLRLIGRGSLGATLVESIDDLPPSLRFYAGGDQSIRGYGYKEIGTEDDSGTVVGGRYLIVGSIEAEKQFKEDWSGAVFWDVGNATDDPGLDFKQGVGAGVRYRLPFGQVRLDVACAVLEDELPVRLHLTVGADL